MLRQQPSAIIFDLDDTLFAERDYVMSGFAAVAEVFSAALATPASELCRTMQELHDGPSRSHVFNALCEELRTRRPLADPIERLIDEMIVAYRSHSPRITLYSDADRALARLAGRLRLGIISDGYLIAQRAKVDALGLRTRVEQIILTDEWGREFWKPHPRAFQEMAMRLGVPPAACTYVADNPAKDFIAPRKLGWRTVMVRRAEGVYAGRSSPPSGAADAIIENLDHLSRNAE